MEGTISREKKLATTLFKVVKDLGQGWLDEDGEMDERHEAAVDLAEWIVALADEDGPAHQPGDHPEGQQLIVELYVSAKAAGNHLLASKVGVLFAGIAFAGFWDPLLIAPAIYAQAPRGDRLRSTVVQLACYRFATMGMTANQILARYAEMECLFVEFLLDVVLAMRTFNTQGYRAEMERLFGGAVWEEAGAE